MQLTEQDLKPIRQKLSKLKTKNVVQGLVSQIGNNVQQHITKGDIMIPKHQIELNVIKKVDKGDSDDCQLKLMEICQKKVHIQRQLQALKKQEQNIRYSKMTNSKLTSLHQYYRSELTSEDIQKLKKLKAQQKRFQKMQAEKTEQYQQRMKKIKQQEEQQKRREKKQKYQIKKQQIQKTLQLIEKRKQQRLERLDQQRKVMKEIKNRKKLHESWEEKWKDVEEQEERKKQELKEELRKINKVSYEDIKEHQRRYQEAIKSQKQSRMKQISTSRMDSSSSPYKSVFLEQILEQETKKKDQAQARKCLPKQFLNKMKQYSEKVKQHHKPNVKNKGEPEPKQQKSVQMRSMSLFESHQKGNEYMKMANLQVLQALKKKDLNTSTTTKQQKELSSQPRYKNYLKQLKSSQQNDKQRKTSDLSTLRSILNKENLTAQQKFYQAKLLTQKMQNRKVVHTSQGIVNSINAKIQILKQVDL